MLDTVPTLLVEVRRVVETLVRTMRPVRIVCDESRCDTRRPVVRPRKHRAQWAVAGRAEREVEHVGDVRGHCHRVGDLHRRKEWGRGGRSHENGWGWGRIE
jgi:hypothetical protein